MKTNLKLDNKNFIAEVSLSNEMMEDEQEIYSAYMSECISNDAMFVDTAGLSTNDAKVMCGISYRKNKPMLSEGAGELTDKQKTLPDAIKKGILKRYEKAGTLSEEGKKQLMSMSSKVEIEIENEEKEDEEEMENENEMENEEELENEEEDEGPEQEMKAEPTAVFIEEPAPPTSAINPTLMNEGLKIDNQLKEENKKEALKNPDLQSPTFKP